MNPHSREGTGGGRGGEVSGRTPCRKSAIDRLMLPSAQITPAITVPSPGSPPSRFAQLAGWQGSDYRRERALLVSAPQAATYKHSLCKAAFVRASEESSWFKTEGRRRSKEGAEGRGRAYLGRVKFILADDLDGDLEAGHAVNRLVDV